MIRNSSMSKNLMDCAKSYLFGRFSKMRNEQWNWIPICSADRKLSYSSDILPRGTYSLIQSYLVTVFEIKKRMTEHTKYVCLASRNFNLISTDSFIFQLCLSLNFCTIFVRSQNIRAHIHTTIKRTANSHAAKTLHENVLQMFQKNTKFFPFLLSSLSQTIVMFQIMHSKFDGRQKE